MSAQLLPADRRYEILDFFHTGGIENAQFCQNCGQVIVRCVVIKSSTGDRHTVGADCAETLCGGLWALETASAAFSTAAPSYGCPHSTRYAAQEFQRMLDYWRRKGATITHVKQQQ